MRQNIYTVRKRRRREGRTDYRKRLKLITSGQTRLVIRKSLSNVLVQFINFTPQGDEVLSSCSSLELKKLGWTSSTGNTPAAYLTGLLAGKKAMKTGVKEAIADIGSHSSVKGSRIYAVIKGITESGLTVPCSDEMFPDEKRISGEHLKKGKAPAQAAEMFNKTKAAIIK